MIGCSTNRSFMNKDVWMCSLFIYYPFIVATPFTYIYIYIYKMVKLNLFSFRFQILRDLIPNSDQKRDTASFLLEVPY